jgi:hypothetical protein
MNDCINKTKDFTDSELGFRRYPREKIIDEHTPTLVKTLFPKLRLFADGTYFYTQKSSSFPFQRGTYSSQKKLNLVKELVFVMRDGPASISTHSEVTTLMEVITIRPLWSTF